MKEEEAVEETEGLTLIDARNVCNELSHLVMLCTVIHRWPSETRFALN